MTLSIEHAHSDEQISAMFGVMSQLRPQLDAGSYVALIRNLMQSEGIRDSSAKAFGDFIKCARARDGCLDFSMSADPVDPGRVNLFECWRDQAALDAWRKVARWPRGAHREKPLEVAVKLY